RGSWRWNRFPLLASHAARCSISSRIERPLLLSQRIPIAPAANFRNPPILWKNNVLLAQK
ncbi:MAG: hypothetical protein NXH80_17290, partial [Rhodobacteraceae bacterium]|nr:hypothetical protein [Paracoccaceae bacterium]